MNVTHIRSKTPVQVLMLFDTPELAAAVCANPPGAIARQMGLASLAPDDWFRAFKTEGGRTRDHM